MLGTRAQDPAYVQSKDPLTRLKTDPSAALLLLVSLGLQIRSFDKAEVYIGFTGTPSASALRLAK